MPELGLLCSHSNHNFPRFHGKRYTMTVFLYRPSPQVPHPSEQAAQRCYDAAVEIITMQSSEIAKGSVDLTWILTQALFMALNTILWSLSYPIIRYDHPIEEVKAYLDVALESINLASERWPGVQSAAQLYQHLIRGCLKVYDSETLDVVRTSPSVHSEPSLLSRTPSCCGESSTGDQDEAQSLVDQAEHFEALENHQDLQHQFNMEQIQQQDPLHLLQSSLNQQSALPPQTNEITFQSRLAVAQNYGVANFNPNSFMNEFPSTIPTRTHWDSNMASNTFPTGFTGYLDVEMDTRPWLGSFGDEYSIFTSSLSSAPAADAKSD